MENKTGNRNAVIAFVFFVTVFLLMGCASKANKCGDGVCSLLEEKNGSCPKDCNAESGSSVEPLNGSVPTNALGPGDYKFSLFHNGLERIYFLHSPPSYDGKKPVPLVIALHGGGGDGKDMEAISLLDAKADQEGFIVVYPNGTGETVLGKLYGTWNAGACCPPAMDNGIDDVGFVSAVIKKVSNDFAIDSNRVFATGFSNGAQMVYRLACELSDKIAAIAPVSGIAPLEKIADCAPKRPVSILHFHGLKDPCVPYAGGTCGGCFAKIAGIIKGENVTAFTWACNSVPNYFAQWLPINQLPNSSKTTLQQGDTTCNTYGPGKNGVEMTLCTIENAGHTWAGGTYGAPCAGGMETNKCKLIRFVLGNMSQDVHATDAIWDFFKKHPLR